MDLKKIILRKLYRHRIICGKHTAVEHLAKGLPKHLIGEAKEVVKQLIKEEGLYWKSLLPMAYKLA